MMQLKVIKIGGNVIDEEKKLHAFLVNFSAIEGFKILVHGGGKMATTIGDKLGITSQYINGRRITDAESLDLVTMVYGGLINKKVVAILQSIECNAIGLTGADGNSMLASKRPVKEIDYGYVGDIDQKGINQTLLKALLELKFVPVIAPLTHNGKGDMLNTNADTIAQKIAKAMANFMKVQLIYCFEKKGLLLDPNNEDTLIPNIGMDLYNDLKTKQIITGGMIPKLDNAFEAIENKVSAVMIGHADDLPDLIAGKAGTRIQ